MDYAYWIGVYGTGGRDDEWPQIHGRFATFLSQNGLIPAKPRQFRGFTGGLGGFPIPLFGSGQDWEAGKDALIDYCDDIPYERMNLIGHSHAVQPILRAAAEGMRIRSLILVGSPVRKDLEEKWAPLAMPNIGHCRHLYDPKFDKTGLAGMFFDGRWSLRRAFKPETGIVSEPVAGMRHSGVLREPKYEPLWNEKGWFDVLRGLGGAAAGAGSARIG